MTRYEHRGRTIRTGIHTTATPWQVWEAWTDLVKLSQWFTDRASGEPKVGTTMIWTFERFNYQFPYQVLRAVPGRSFVVQASPPGRGPAILEITIDQEGGHTVMHLVNSGFSERAEWDEEYQGVVSGWGMALSVLKHYLENYFGQSRSSFFVMQPAGFSYERLLPYYTQAVGLSRWLAASATIGGLGERCDLVLRDEGQLTGRVLAITGREVSLSWEQINGVLGLKAFSLGPDRRMIAVAGSGWGLAPSRAAAVETAMTVALSRLAAILPAAPAD